MIDDIINFQALVAHSLVHISSVLCVAVAKLVKRLGPLLLSHTHTYT